MTESREADQVRIAILRDERLDSAPYLAHIFLESDARLPLSRTIWPSARTSRAGKDRATTERGRDTATHDRGLRNPRMRNYTSVHLENAWRVRIGPSFSCGPAQAWDAKKRVLSDRLNTSAWTLGWTLAVRSRISWASGVATS